MSKNKIKITITGHQLWALVAVYTCGTTILVVSSGLAGMAKQDAWIAVIVTTIIGLLFVSLYAYLGYLYPNNTLIEMIQLAFGKIIGRIIVACFIFFCIVNISQVIYYINSFMIKEYMDKTPPYAIALVCIIALSIALYYGIETIARSAEIFVYYISFMFILAMLLVIPNVKIDNLLPILEDGIVPVLKGSIQLSGYITWPLILILMIYPKNIDYSKEATRSLFRGYLWAAFLIFISNTMAILVLGSNIASKSLYPTYLLATEINVGMILTRVEGVIASVWIITVFFRALLYFYGIVVGMSQLIGLKDYKTIILPVGLIVLILSDVIYPNYAYEVEYDSKTWILFSFTFGAILPLILLAVTFIKSKYKNFSTKN